MQLRIICGDITTWPAQAIVNSASESLMSTGGLDNRIYQAGGISLRAACSSLGGCPEGKAVLTFGYKLPARYVIHTVAPFWRGGGHHEESQLLSCYRASLALAREREVHHLAFSSLGTADKRIPLNRAADVAIPALLEEGFGFSHIDLVCETREEQDAYTKAAVFYWLQQINDAAKEDIHAILEKALMALTVLRQTSDGREPMAQADMLLSLRHTLHPFAALPAPRSIMNLESTARQVMDIYHQAGTKPQVN